MESFICVQCGAKISKHALLCPSCHALGFVARGNTPQKRNFGIALVLAGISATVLVEMEPGSFADKAASFTEGLLVGLGMVIAFIIPKRKSAGEANP